MIGRSSPWFSARFGKLGGTNSLWELYHSDLTFVTCCLRYNSFMAWKLDNTAKNANKKSPLKRSNRRLPGQSLDEQISKVRDDFFSETLFPLFLFLFFAMFEWFRWIYDVPPKPALFTVLALLGACWAAYRFRSGKETLRRLKLGRDGEREVGEMLEKLRASGYHVFHDFCGEDWNIDHVLVGPSGVYTVETKTLMKPKRGRSEIVYDKNSIQSPVGDLSKHLVQVKAQASTCLLYTSPSPRDRG